MQTVLDVLGWISGLLGHEHSKDTSTAGAAFLPPPRPPLTAAWLIPLAELISDGGANRTFSNLKALKL